MDIELTYDQWQVLKEVALNEDNSHQKHLALSLTKDDASVMRILEILIQSGYATKEKQESDKRFSSVRLTEKGWGFYEKHFDAINKLHDRLFWGFTEGEIKIVESMLKKMLKNIVLN